MAALGQKKKMAATVLTVILGAVAKFYVGVAKHSWLMCHIGSVMALIVKAARGFLLQSIRQPGRPTP